MAALWKRLRELELTLKFGPKVHQATIGAEIRRIRGEILLRQDEPWPEDVKRERHDEAAG